MDVVVSNEMVKTDSEDWIWWVCK